jgi:hypothetical protein
MFKHLESIPLFPTFSINKAKLRSLLAHLAQPDAGKLPLSAADRRKTQQWAIAAGLLDERGLTIEGSTDGNKSLKI